MRATLRVDIGRRLRIAPLALAAGALAFAQVGCGAGRNAVADAPPESAAPPQSTDTGAVPQSAIGSSSAFFGLLLVLIQQRARSGQVEPARARPRQAAPGSDAPLPTAVGG